MEKLESPWFIAVGAARCAAARLLNRGFWFAFGLGLALQADFMLALDCFAKTRAHEYFKAVLGS